MQGQRTIWLTNNARSNVSWIFDILHWNNRDIDINLDESAKNSTINFYVANTLCAPFNTLLARVKGGIGDYD